MKRKHAMEKKKEERARKEEEARLEREKKELERMETKKSACYLEWKEWLKEHEEFREQFGWICKETPDVRIRAFMKVVNEMVNEAEETLNPVVTKYFDCVNFKVKVNIKKSRAIDNWMKIRDDMQLKGLEEKMKLVVMKAKSLKEKRKLWKEKWVSQGFEKKMAQIGSIIVGRIKSYLTQSEKRNQLIKEITCNAAKKRKQIKGILQLEGVWKCNR